MPVRAYAYALAAIALWGTLAVLSVHLSVVPPFLLVGLALTIGGICSLPRVREWRVPPSTLALGVTGIFVYHLCLFLALRRAPAVEANLLNYLWPLLIVVLSPLFLPGVRLRSRQVLAGVIGFSGAALVVTHGSIHVELRYATGYLLALLAAFLWATYSLLTKRVRPFPSAAVGLFCAVSGVLSLLAHAAFEPAATLRSIDLARIALLGVGPMGAAFFFWDAAMKAGDPRIIGALAYMTPLLSTTLLILFGGGVWSVTVGVGMAAIVVAAIVGATA
jgi:drug/metabolite transporter (DMT)-like permease